MLEMKQFHVFFCCFYTLFISKKEKSCMCRIDVYGERRTSAWYLSFNLHIEIGFSKLLIDYATLQTPASRDFCRISNLHSSPHQFQFIYCTATRKCRNTALKQLI